MSYQPTYVFSSECKKQLLSGVGEACYTYILNTLKKNVFNEKLVPARDGKFLDGARRQPRGVYFTLDFAIPYPLSPQYDFVHLRIIKTTVEHVEYIIVGDYELHERESRE